MYGLTCTGRPSPLGAHNRLIGTEGIIEIDPTDLGLSRIWRMGGRWEPLDHGGESVHGPGNNERSIAHVIECLETGAEPETGARNALQATELFFAAWESSRLRGRVDLPLDIEDNPLVAMVESGDLTPKPPQQRERGEKP